jgi:hypothetical protein
LVGPCHHGNGTSSGCGRRRPPPHMEVRCECTEKVVMDIRQGTVLQLVSLAGATQILAAKEKRVIKCYTELLT